MSDTTILFHPSCVLHEAPDHPESPMRIQVIQNALQKADPSYKFRESKVASRAQLEGAHDVNYIDWLFSIAPKKGFLALDTDTIMNPHTLTAALHAAGAVVDAVDLVMQKQTQSVFCNIRPPGHHATADRAMGFCFFNNVVIGARHAIAQYGLKRIAIVDFDVHHGNGTQAIVQNDERILYCSSFQHPFYPGYSPTLDNPHILSVPLPAGCDGKIFREKTAHAWFKAIDQFGPELILFSAGFDAHKNDPLANLKLTCADFVWLTENIVALAQSHCPGRVISALEGGYNLNVLAECVPAHVKAMT